MIHKCPQCQREFLFPSTSRKYCSRKCQSLAKTIDLDTKQVFAAYDAGATMVEIAQKMNVSKTPIRLALLKEGYKSCPRPKKVMRLDTGEIFASASLAATLVGFSKSAVSLAIRRKTKCAGSYWEYIN